MNHSDHALNVYLQDILAGQLSLTMHYDMQFTYDIDYLEQKNPPISRSLPLKPEPYPASQCRPYFSGILPEAHVRSAVAKQLGISPKNDYALLDAIGGECAGAVTILPQHIDLNTLKSDYKPLTTSQLDNILHNLHQKPMIDGEGGVRLSLAGAQDKLPVAYIDGQIYIPIGRAPSTHIIKPANPNFPGLIENEAFCLDLAKRIGLKTCEAELKSVNQLNYLMIERYDRVKVNHTIKRLHQEDFCQALGVLPERKYQREGGPNISACNQLIKEASSLPILDIKLFIQAILFNIIIGNCDAHSKNFSLLYSHSQTRLAPLYDLISTAYFPPLSTKFAMKIGSKYDFETLMPRHLMQMAEQCGWSKSQVYQLAITTVEQIEACIKSSRFKNIIVKRAKRLFNILKYGQE